MELKIELPENSKRALLTAGETRDILRFPEN